MTLDYQVTFGGIPFVTDAAVSARMPFPHSEQLDPEQSAPRKHQPLADLIDELNRLILPVFTGIALDLYE